MEELLAPIDQRMVPGEANLVTVFSTAHFEDDLELIMERITTFFPSAVTLGCTAEGTIGVETEIERSPSITLLAASLPGVEIRPFELVQDQLENAQSEEDWQRMVGVASGDKPVFIACADPFYIDVQRFVRGINESFPGAALLGGVASAGYAPNQNRLVLNGRIVREGIVGVALAGDIEVRTVVSQGCRPIGIPFVITRGERDVVRELGGKPVLKQLHQVMIDLPDRDEKLARESLLLGRVIDEHKEKFGRGDFLIHNITGVDQRSGAIRISGHARTGATVQFHVRDAESADEDLKSLLTPFGGAGVQAAMIFSCNGRGTNMWPFAGHDARVVYDLVGDVPAAGFFCGGEFGPVGGRNFIHGFTASIALLSPRAASISKNPPG